MIITKPSLNDAPAYYHTYFNLVPENDLIAALDRSMQKTLKIMKALKEENFQYAYAPGKWTIAEVFQHIIDCEKVLSYRAFRFSRFDATPLSGFVEDAYIEASRRHPLSMEKLISHYELLRLQSIAMFESMDDEMLDFKGVANQLSMNARGIGFMLAGHNIHHVHVVETRYLNTP